MRLSTFFALVTMALAPALQASAQEIAPLAPPATTQPPASAPPAVVAPAPAAPAPEQAATAPEQAAPVPNEAALAPIEPAPPQPAPAPAAIETAAPTPAPAVTASAEATTPATPIAATASASATPASAEPPEDELPWALVHRRFSTREGTSGGLMIEEPGSGEVGALRLQLMIDVAPSDDFAVANNQTGRTDKTLSVSWTALEMLEIFATLRDRNTTQSQPIETSIYSQGALLGFKLFAPIGRIFSAGGSLRFAMQNELGGSAPLLKATSVGIRAAGSADLRQVHKRVPLIARLNLDYLFDNSAAVIADTEAQRFAALGPTAAPRNETRNLISREERYALDINRVDRLTFGLGLEAPLKIGDQASLHPLLEWRIAIPINRQEFDCAIVRGVRNDGTRNHADSCLGSAGTDAWPANLTMGIRIVPPVRGLSLLFALDIGLAGSSVFVRELAPVAPFALTLALGYDYDAKPHAKPDASPEQQEPDETRAE